MLKKFYPWMKALALASLCAPIWLSLPIALADGQANNGYNELDRPADPDSSYTNNWYYSDLTINAGAANFLAEIQSPADQVKVWINGNESSNPGRILNKDGRYFVYVEISSPNAFDQGDRVDVIVYQEGIKVQLPTVEVRDQ